MSDTGAAPVETAASASSPVGAAVYLAHLREAQAPPALPEPAVPTAEQIEWALREAELTTGARKALDKSQFAIPEKAPGPGSYPIQDRAHAANALARSAGRRRASRPRSTGNTPT